MRKVFCIGNGESRKDFDLEQVRSLGKIYGCNALYRDFTPDVLIAVDSGIIHEIYDSGYACDNECWFRGWRRRHADEYDKEYYGVVTDEEKKEVEKYYTNRTENKRGDSNYFVINGSSYQSKLSIIKRYKDKNALHAPQFDIEMNMHGLHVSWLHEDKAKDLIEISPERRDLGMAAGSTSGYVACYQNNPTECYLLGQDFGSPNNFTNNLYKDTANYAKSTDTATKGTKWKDGWKRLFHMFSTTKFIQVNKTKQPIEEWKDIKNISYETYETFLHR